MPFSIAGRTFSETRLTLSCAKSAKSDILVSWDACCFSEWAAVQNWETYTSHSQVNLWILSESQKEVLSHINTVLNCSVFICYQIYAFGMLKNSFFDAKVRSVYISRVFYKSWSPSLCWNGPFVFIWNNFRTPSGFDSFYFHINFLLH